MTTNQPPPNWNNNPQSQPGYGYRADSSYQAGYTHPPSLNPPQYYAASAQHDQFAAGGGSGWEPPSQDSDRDYNTTWLLALFLGGLGVDRFYLGKFGSGIAKILTLGGAGIWWLIDVIASIAGNAKDAAGRPVKPKKPEHRVIGWVTASAMIVISIVFGNMNPDTDEADHDVADSPVALSTNSEDTSSTQEVAPKATKSQTVEAEPVREETAPKTDEGNSSSSITVSQSEALESAESYLSFMSFSREGLIDQLEYEGFSTEDATYAADNVGADWMEEAVRSAESYLRTMAFSEEGLIDQLLFEGFTQEQAEYGVQQAYGDPTTQAIASAESYLRTMAFSREGLIDQLVFEGFTVDVATAAVDSITVDWNEQAAEQAESYLRFTSFSRSGLIDQLIFEGFTQSQAEYGANAVGL